MPDFDKLHEHARQLAALTTSAQRSEGMGMMWSKFTGEHWKAIAEMWDPDTAADRRNESAAWEETAKQAAENAQFYKGLITQIGQQFGAPAYTSDDGSVQDGVLALKVPELVRQLRVHADRLQEENDSLEADNHRLKILNGEGRRVYRRSHRNPHFHRRSESSAIVIAGALGGFLGWLAGRRG